MLWLFTALANKKDVIVPSAASMFVAVGGYLYLSTFEFIRETMSRLLSVD